MVVSIVLTLALISFQKLVLKKTDAVAIQDDAVHYKMDILVNLGVIASLVLVSQFDWLLANHCL
jgi:ferrous-iron efflux pump FieF